MVDAIEISPSTDAIKVKDVENQIDIGIVEETFSVAAIKSTRGVLSTKDEDAVSVSDISGDTVQGVPEGHTLLNPEYKEVAIFNYTAEEEVAYIDKTDFVGDNIVYQGQALPGTAIGSANWKITRITFLNDEGDVDTEFAESNADFVHIWANRAGYNYG